MKMRALLSVNEFSAAFNSRSPLNEGVLKIV